MRQEEKSIFSRREVEKIFKGGFEECDSHPQRVLLRLGQGLNLQLYTGKSDYFQICVSAVNDGGPAFAATRTSLIRYMGESEVSPTETQWVEKTIEMVESLEMDFRWAQFLADAQSKPGLSYRSEGGEEKTTSGPELVIRLLEACNAACDFCGCIGVERDYAERLDEVRERVMRAKKEGYGRVVFTGGEPTLVAGLPRLVMIAKQEGIDTVYMQTNAIRLSEKPLTEELAKAGLDGVLVSLHSHRAEVHDGIMKTEGAFENAVQGIENCIDAGIRVSLNYVINKDNYEEISEYVRFVGLDLSPRLYREQLDRIDVTLSYCSPVGRTLEHLDQIPNIEVVAPKLAEALDLSEELHLMSHIPGLCGVPVCVMPGYEEYFEEAAGGTPPLLPTREYFSACDSCDWRPQCSGYWSEYVEMYGDDVFGQDPDKIPWARGPEPAPSPKLLEAMGQLLDYPVMKGWGHAGVGSERISVWRFIRSFVRLLLKPNTSPETLDWDKSRLLNFTFIAADRARVLSFVGNFGRVVWGLFVAKIRRKIGENVSISWRDDPLTARDIGDILNERHVWNPRGGLWQERLVTQFCAVHKLPVPKGAPR